MTRSHPAAWVSLDDLGAVADLLGALSAVGAGGQVTALLARDPAAHASLDDRIAVAVLLRGLRQAGASGQVTAEQPRRLKTRAHLTGYRTRLSETRRNCEPDSVRQHLRRQPGRWTRFSATNHWIRPDSVRLDQIR